MYTLAFLATETGDTVDGFAGFDVSIQSVGLIGFGALAIWLIFTGRLLPKGLVDSLLKAKDDIIASQRETISAYEESASASKKLYDAVTAKAEANSDGT